MSSNYVKSFDLTERLDAEFYKDIYISIDSSLKSTGQYFALRDVLTKLQLGYTGQTEKYYAKDGIYYLSSKNIINGFVEITEETDLISLNAHNKELSKSAVYSGDLLITRTGTVGKSAVVPIYTDTFNIAAHIISVNVNNKLDVFFLSSFFNSSYGILQSKRHQRGTIIKGLSIYDIPNFIIPMFKNKTQKYIGDKVRQAEQLRTWGKKIENKVNQFHFQLIPEQNKLNYGKKIRYVKSSNMTERFDAHFYPAVVEDYLSSSNIEFDSLDNLSIEVFNGQTQDETTDYNSANQITVAHLSPVFLKGNPRQVIKPSNNSRYTQKHDLLLCNAAHNKSYIGRDITYCHTNKPLLPSTEVMVIRIPNEQIPASFVRCYLQTKIGYIQIQSTIRGISAHSYPNDVKQINIPIPNIPSHLKQKWFACDEQMLKAGMANELSTQLVDISKFLVEALIEGQITEQQIIDAQNALEAGDNSLDRDILSRVTDKGFDFERKSLFHDLDNLYDLLQESQEAFEQKDHE